MLIGYIRPLQDDLQCEEQKVQLMKKNCDKIFQEAHPSAKKRIVLEKLIESLEEDNTLIVTKLSALADSTHHLTDLLAIIEEKGAYLYSLQERIDTRTEGYSFFYIVKQLAEFQSEIISEKTRKGMNKAKEKGGSLGRPRKPDENVKRAILMYKSKQYTLKEIREETGISKSTLYRYLES